MKKITGILLLSILILLFSGCSKDNKSSDNPTGNSADGYTVLNSEYDISISTDKSEYKEGDTIIVSVQSGDWYNDTSAWIGIIPSAVEHGKETVNDENDIDYRYLTDMTGEKMEFIAPVPGNYDLRISNDDNEDSIEIGYITFTVK